jgi:hypothetical protein
MSSDTLIYETILKLQKAVNLRRWLRLFRPKARLLQS